MIGKLSSLVTDPRTDKIVLVLSLLVSIVSYSFWGLIKEEYGISIFYLGNALSVFGFTLVLCKRFNNWVTELVLAATTNNLVDEVFFDPTTIEINEYILFGVSVAIIWKRNSKTSREGLRK